MKTCSQPGRLLFALLCLACLLTVAGTVAAQDQGGADYVVLFSIDGLKPEYYFHPQELGLNLPNLQTLRDTGSFAYGLVGQYPSVTRPSHTSIVTVVRPAKHGIVHNTLFDPVGDYPRSPLAAAIKVPTLWDAAGASGLTTSAVSWPITAGAQIDYLIDSGETPVPPGTSPPDYYRGGSTPGLVDKIVKQSRGEPAAELDAFRAEAASFIIRTYRPNLVLIHFSSTDAAQHRFGVHSGEASQAYARTDRNVGTVLDAIKEAGIWERTAVVVTGDHGFVNVHAMLQPNVVLRQAGFIQTDEAGNIEQWEAAAHGVAIRLKDPSDSDLAQKVEALFREMANGRYRGIFRLVSRTELDALGAFPGALLALEPTEGYYISSRSVFDLDEFVVPATVRGMHGYIPNHPKMHTGLILSGSGIRKGIQIPIARQIDIAPTVAELLGLSLGEVDGLPLVSILE